MSRSTNRDDGSHSVGKTANGLPALISRSKGRGLICHCPPAPYLTPRARIGYNPRQTVFWKEYGAEANVSTQTDPAPPGARLSGAHEYAGRPEGAALAASARPTAAHRRLEKPSRFEKRKPARPTSGLRATLRAGPSMGSSSASPARVAQRVGHNPVRLLREQAGGERRDAQSG